MREGSKNKLRRTSEKKCLHGHGRSHIAPEISSSPLELVERDSWENFPSELLLDIIQRLEATQTMWPARRDVVACASVCRGRFRSRERGGGRVLRECRRASLPEVLNFSGKKEGFIIESEEEEEEDRQQGSHARWMNCQGLWGRVPAWLFDWVKPSSRSLLSSSCVWMLSSIAILLSASWSVLDWKITKGKEDRWLKYIEGKNDFSMIMSFKRMFRELREMREGSKNKLRRTSEKKCLHGHGRSHVAPEISSSPLELVERNSWENFPSELLLDIIQRLEATQTLWPARRDVVACASVCRSNFLGSKFSIYDSQRPCDHAIRSNGRSHRKCNYNVATISYELNVLRTKGPRRMLCTMNSIPTSAVQGGGIAPTVATFGNFLNEQCSHLSVSKGKNLVKFGSNSLTEPLEPVHDTRDPLILKNKAPRWHGQLQCWCLNFKGRVTVASVKNFQLVAAIEPCQNVPAAEQEKVMPQFGKIGKDIFTMDYHVVATMTLSLCRVIWARVTWFHKRPLKHLLLNVGLRSGNNDIESLQGYLGSSLMVL
ncbi:hypothetical protein TEA_021020 [Camellia sinensis var. sinensis]|uniref:Tubby C-terminal domain-containing protein n=1 Tax=Camellia sinensis var. sinensis TaxID=542762 RepID=A0A4S4E3V1_CAMSN|nr:hypothetical protein TEA_021020 [Camellia sinensis var. sinensis]